MPVTLPCVSVIRVTIRSDSPYGRVRRTNAAVAISRDTRATDRSVSLTHHIRNLTNRVLVPTRATGMAEGKDDRPGVDEAPGGASEERPSNDREALEGTLAAAREEARQNHDRWLRAVAELENFKKRMERERAEATRFANEAFIRDLLPVVDNLERALEVVHHGEEVADERLVGEPCGLGAFPRHSLLEVLELRDGAQPPIVILARLFPRRRQRAFQRFAVVRRALLGGPPRRLIHPRPVVLPFRHASGPSRHQNPVC